jgi:hypothetical protein
MSSENAFNCLALLIYEILDHKDHINIYDYFYKKQIINTKFYL